MFKFLIRVLILLLIISLFLAGIIAAIELVKGSSLLSRHHGIIVAYLGVFFSLASLTYSLRKYGLVLLGSLGTWLKSHVIIGSIGLLLVLTHSQFEFQALVPGLLAVAMVILGLSGLFGWYMYRTKVQSLLTEIKSLEEAEEVFLAKMASTAFRFWRFIHILAAFVALFFTIVHGISLVVFRGQF